MQAPGPVEIQQSPAAGPAFATEVGFMPSDGAPTAAAMTTTAAEDVTAAGTMVAAAGRASTTQIRPAGSDGQLGSSIAVHHQHQHQHQQEGMVTSPQAAAGVQACLVGLTRLVANNTSFPMLALADTFKAAAISSSSGSSSSRFGPAGGLGPHASVTFSHHSVSASDTSTKGPGNGSRSRSSRVRSRALPYQFPGRSSVGLPGQMQAGAGVLRCKGLRHLELQGIVTEPWRCRQHGSSCNCMVSWVWNRKKRLRYRGALLLVKSQEFMT